MEEKFNAWMPLSKSVDGKFVGILSDTSLDRDNEYMTKELLDSWAKTDKSLPMLANHENKMEKFIGGWTNKTVVNKGDNFALTAEPFFFSKEANPLAEQVKKQVEEALDNGLNIGISIGAIPSESVKKDVNGEMVRAYTKAEIVEATVVPIQSNRNASFTALAKSFDIQTTKGCSDKVKACVKDVMTQGKSEESAYKICNAKLGNKEIEMEVVKMTEENTEVPVEEKLDELEKPKEEATEEAPEEVEEDGEEDELVDATEDIEENKNAIAELQKKIEALTKQVQILKMPDNNEEVAGDGSKQVTKASETLFDGLKVRYGGR